MATISSNPGVWLIMLLLIDAVILLKGGRYLTDYSIFTNLLA